MTAMADEIAEAPDAAARLLQAGTRIDAIAAALRASGCAVSDTGTPPAVSGCSNAARI